MGILYVSHIPEDAHEIPPILYIAMGTYNNDNYAGWFNGLNYDIFEVSGYEPKTASVAGGFWFSIMWETKTRYVFPYFF